MSDAETIYTKHPDSAPWEINARIIPYLQLARLYDWGICCIASALRYVVRGMESLCTVDMLRHSQSSSPWAHTAPIWDGTGHPTALWHSGCSLSQLTQGSRAQELDGGQLAPCSSLGAHARAADPRCANRGSRRTYFGGLHVMVPLHHSSMDDTTRYHCGSLVRSRSTDDDTICKYSSTLIIMHWTYMLYITLIHQS